MAKDQNSIKIQTYLTNMGFKVEKIKESKIKTPDLSAIDENGQNYIFEVKSLSTDRLKPSENESEDELVIRSGSHAKDNTVSGKIEVAYNQLKAYNNSINIVWLILQENGNRFLEKNIKRTIYGTKFVSDSKLESSKICFNADRSDFFRFKDFIDGIILSDHIGCELLLNSYSNKYNLLKKSLLFNKLGQSVFDPIHELNKDDYYLYLEPDDLNKNETYALEKIKIKYGFSNPRFVEITHFKFIDKLPKEKA